MNVFKTIAPFLVLSLALACGEQLVEFAAPGAGDGGSADAVSEEAANPDVGTTDRADADHVGPDATVEEGPDAADEVAPSLMTSDAADATSEVGPSLMTSDAADAASEAGLELTTSDAADAAREASHTTASATSCGRPIRRSGSPSATALMSAIFEPSNCLGAILNPCARLIGRPLELPGPQCREEPRGGYWLLLKGRNGRRASDSLASSSP